jgi:hypothetical protein
LVSPPFLNRIVRFLFAKVSELSTIKFNLAIYPRNSAIVWPSLTIAFAFPPCYINLRYWIINFFNAFALVDKILFIVSIRTL